MKLNLRTTLLATLVAGPAQLTAQVAAQSEADPPTFDSAIESFEQGLTSSVAELEALRQEILEERLPLNRRLTELERERAQARAAYDDVTRTLATRTLDLTQLVERTNVLEQETSYLSGLLVDYVQNFRGALHPAEADRYAEPLDAALMAGENAGLTREEVFERQAKLLDVSIDRLLEVAGGTIFEGRAVGADGLVDEGTFALVGPLALFRSFEGQVVGSAETRGSSGQARVVEFEGEADRAVAERLLTTGTGSFPADTTLGNATKIAATDDSFLAELDRGGVVIYPILAMASVALLVALWKWVTLSLVRRPSRAEIGALLEAVASRDGEAAEKEARRLRGPVGRMLAAGVEHLDHPRELVEEAMYEMVLTTRLRLNRMLPFIAICAASAPLLGLLGTVTGIINTFKQITLFGSGDVKMLSGGISEALITTKYGLIVAIPSLMLHAFLARKARGIVGQMESAAVSFLNEVAKMPGRRRAVSTAQDRDELVPQPDPDLVRRQVAVVLEDLLGPIVEEGKSNSTSTSRAGA